jgi:large subunit ribosomal protein L25
VPANVSSRPWELPDRLWYHAAAVATNVRPELTAQHREVTGKKVARLRREGVLPAVLYGHGHDSENLQVDARAFEQLRRKIGRNALVDLHVANGSALPVLVQHVQEHPINRRPVHIDFYLVSMTEELEVEVPVVFTGHSEAAEKEGGTLLHLINQVTIRALPGEIPESLTLDVTPLETFDEVLHVSDIPIPPGVTLVTDPTEAIARVQPPRVEEEPTVAPAEGVEGAEGAEGAAAEGAAPAEGAEGAAGERAESGERGEKGERAERGGGDKGERGERSRG